MKLTYLKSYLAAALIVAGVAFGVYTEIAWTTFRWRNPTANSLSYWRDFGAVHRFERVDAYQGR